MNILQFTVHGIPAPQGSKRHIGRGVMIESSKKVKPWREAVKWAALEAMRPHQGKLDGPLLMRVHFYLPRPKAAKAAVACHKMPDLSKLIRATEDAITEAGCWADDARVVEVQAIKLYEDSDNRPGARVTIHGWEPHRAA
ncbi:MAG: RusA family crossover junction endodeoxyribonuclease [Lysobacterales bacterium]|jgi:Holliday junction resolvase RusA-like endonuclease